MTLKVDKTNLIYLYKIQGNNPKVSEVIWLIIDLILDCITKSILGKFGEDKRAIVWLRERTNTYSFLYN